MRTIVIAALGAAALALAACTNPNPEETATAAAMPDTTTTQSPAPSAGETGVAGPGAQPATGVDATAETEQNLPPVDLPQVPN
ncbi:hypothetical protein [Phenylobacterium sp.]|uniref:hypothetical protein n=1 Tax=Phenylobacterium sp. TaxID=1871053 RepID=UPI002FDB0CB7